MNKYLADTTVLIDHLRRNEKATEFIEKHNLSISIVTIAELIQGARNAREQSMSIKLSNSMAHIFIDRKISNLALELLSKFHLSNGLNFWDAIIAASALDSKLTLVTENLKHFKFITGLQVLPQKEAFAKV
jgi:predicted nucleic acid-binding protein